MKRACFNNVTGLLLADKMGEIGFINLSNVSLLPGEGAVEEESKALELAEGELPPFEDKGVYKTLYGHQETCLGMQLSDDSRLIASCDTLKKVNVANWPNVFNLQSVLLEHTKPITYMCFLGTDKIASVSESHPSTGAQDLIISSAMDAQVLC